MRHFTVLLLLVLAVVLPSINANPYSYSSSRQTDPGDGPGGVDNDGPGGVDDDDPGADGNVPDLGDGNGIPDVSNATNPLCVPWYGIRDAILGGIFHGRCGDEARASVRLAFHDAGTFSDALKAQGLPNGAADGSMIWDPTEVLRTENDGLQPIVSILSPLPAQFGVSPGDLLHLAGVLGVLACPGGPRINAFIGRPFPLNVAPMGLLPSPEDPVPKLIARFADMGFTVRDLMALVGAHSTGKQRFVDPALANSSFDSTVDIWDVRFYAETAAPTTPPDVLKLDSDVNFSHNASTFHEFHRFINNQEDWDEDYRSAHLKMMLLGQNISTLTNCTELMPASINLTNLTINGTVDPTLLEAAIQKYRAPWLS
ncbi:Peroxidase [Mycena venus]|uniref:Peroxidase n=1 Tax=Mycena venus TaxID=2733690 RepID=A0A8H6Y4J2_9AGAR|nr:Peroxidase [Mycena venus]